MMIEIRDCEDRYFPSLECMKHWRNAGNLSWPDLGVLATILKGDMWRADVGSREIWE